MSSKIHLMAHLVAGYPTDELAFAAAQGLAEGGVTYFEVQLPFSDPCADGVAIQQACATVLSQGYRVKDGFTCIAHVHEAFPEIPLFVMTYGNLAYRRGIDRFVKDAYEAGSCGLIVPDLPFDHDEGLAQSCTRYNLHAVPVAAPSMTAERIAALRADKRPYIYATLRAGITGTPTAITPGMLSFLHSLGTDSRILGGFGIRSAQQAAMLAPSVHAVVAGSVFVELINRHAKEGPQAVRQAVREKARQLSGS